MSTLSDLAFKFIRSLLNASRAGPSHGAAPPGLALPHPEEPPDNSRKLENTRIEDVVRAWLQKWNVPGKYHRYWQRECNIRLSLKYKSPAATISPAREIYVRPEWANPGVVAHEACHIVWYFLPKDLQGTYQVELNAAFRDNPLLRLAWATKTYMQSNTVEAHADVYRYLGDKMPEQLKKYYPRLLF